MKRILIIGLLFLLCHIYIQAQTTSKEYLITFDTSQYYIKADTAGLSLIVGPQFYLDDFDLPCLPYTQRRILLPYGTEVDSCIVHFDKLNLWKEDIVLAANPPKLPIGSDFDVFDSAGNISYPDSIYPTKTVSYGEEVKHGYVLIWVCVSPFIYNVKAKQVYITSSITVQLKLKQRSNISKPDLSPSTISSIKYLVINPQETDSYQIASEDIESYFSPLDVTLLSGKGEISIYLNQACETSLAFELFSVDGKKVYTTNFESGETEKTITGLSSGLYLYGLKDKKGIQVNKKIIIQ